MKKYIKPTLAAMIAAVTLTACEDLDVENKSQYVTADQKEAVLNINPGMGVAGLAGISATVNQYQSVYANHFDFGYASVMLGTDLQGVDMVSSWSGYNWFRYWEGFTSPTANGTPSAEMWYTIFKQIFACNAVCTTIPADTESKSAMFQRAQAVMTRAWDYWILANYYQFNYEGHENALCVPIVTDENAKEVEEKGAPRATVQEVYDQILKDATEAISLIEASGMNPDDMIASKPKRFGSLATAYGVRARAYLTMHKYDLAADDAQKAIENFAGQGAPLSISEAARPGFWSLDSKNWMWGIPVNESDRVVTSGIVNFPSHICTFSGNSYVSVGAFRCINVALYENIPVSDSRKGWWLDENNQSANLTAAEQRYIDNLDVVPDPYCNVKFAGYQDVPGTTTNANDIPLMRIEEMYYIVAEGLAMSGKVSEGVAFLNDFVKNYRDPKYNCTATTPEDAQEAVYQQRRIEFWGEGLSYIDLMRLDKEIDRWGCNWPTQATFRIPSSTGDPAKAGVRIYCIPQGEINGNPAITESQNNPTCSAPNGTWK